MHSVLNIVQKKSLFFISTLILFAVFITPTLIVLFLVFLIYFFRNPEIQITQNQNAILTPIDGEIIAIDNINDKYLIYIKLNLFDKHILKSCEDGNIVITKNKNGLNLNPMYFLSKHLNTSSTITSKNTKISIIGNFYQDIFCTSSKKEKQNQGDEIGVILNGLIIIEFDFKYKLSVKIGDKVKSAQNILAQS